MRSTGNAPSIARIARHLLLEWTAGLHTPSAPGKALHAHHPAQVFLAANPAQPDQAKAISSFNLMFSQRAQPEWKTYQWKADDGTMVEGILIYPPHRMGEKKLRMLTLIHGGPAEANGNYFEADWYEWATLRSGQWLAGLPP